MAENSSIQWTTHTFNHVRGCTKVSAGCAACYAEAGSARNPKVLGRWGPNGTRVVASEAMWRNPAKWDRVAKESGDRPRVFCASLADVFEEWNGPMVDSQERKLYLAPSEKWRPDGLGCPVWEPGWRPLTMDDVRARLLHTIHWTEGLDYLLLTKRPENVLPQLRRINETMKLHWCERDWIVRWLDGKPPRNVWLGTTVEDRKSGLPRIDVLRSIPARVRFLSCEPLLEDLGRLNLSGIDLVIVGGESSQGGQKARPFDLQWARDIVAQCRDQGVKAFVKQLGTRPVEIHADRYRGYEVRLKDSHGGDPAEWPEDLRAREMPAPAEPRP
jgi:protein gp37